LEKSSGQLYFPEANELQLTFRSVAIGCIIGSILAAMNIYMGLTTGWTFSGSIIAAVLSYSIFRALKVSKPFSVLETNIAQTTGSATGAMASAAGLISSLPALKLMGHDLSFIELMIWGASVSFLGVFFIIPLREQIIVREKLCFPSGLATAETIQSLFDEGNVLSAKKSSRFLWFALFSAFFTLVAYYLPIIEEPNLLPVIGLSSIAAWGFSILISPTMFGVGMIVGQRVGISLALGAVVGWGLLGPLSSSYEWVTGPIMDIKTGPRGWILWPGVALMVSESLMSVAFSWKSVVSIFKNSSGKVVVTENQVVPRSVWFAGFSVVLIALTTSAYFIFSIHPIHSLIAVCLSSVLAIIGTRASGETDINPIGGMGKITQIAFAAVDPGAVETNVLAAGITGAGAKQAGDLMQDLKTGYMLGASPRKQFYAQCVGILFGVFVAVPIYKLFDTVYEIGGEKMTAPAAHSWKAMAELVTGGTGGLPQHVGVAIVCAAIFGAGCSVAKRFEALRPWTPSAMAMGIAFIVKPYLSLAMFLGSLFLVYWARRAPNSASNFAVSIAAGLLAGGAIMGVGTALLSLLGF